MNATQTKPVTSQAPTMPPVDVARINAISAADELDATQKRLKEIKEWQATHQLDPSLDGERAQLTTSLSPLTQLKERTWRQWEYEKSLVAKAEQEARLRKLPEVRRATQDAIKEYEAALVTLISIAEAARPTLHDYNVLAAQIEQHGGTALPHYAPTLKAVNLSSILNSPYPLHTLNEQLTFPSIR